MNIIPDDSRVLWRALLGRMEMKWSSVGTSTFLLAWLTAQSMGLWKEHPVMLSAVAEWWSGQITQLWASFRCQCFKCHVNYCDLQLPSVRGRSFYPGWVLEADGVCRQFTQPTLEQLMGCSLCEGLMLEKFVETCFPWEGPHNGAVEEHEESCPWGGSSGRDNVWWNDHRLHFPNPCTTGRVEVQKIRSEVELRKKGGVGRKMFLRFCFSHYHILILLVIN